MCLAFWTLFVFVFRSKWELQQDLPILFAVVAGRRKKSVQIILDVGRDTRGKLKGQHLEKKNI